MKTIVNLIKTSPLFSLIVLIPTLCSLFYYSIWAANIYVAESSFVIKSSKSQNAGLEGMILHNIGFNRSQDDSYVVNNYILSRDVLISIDQQFSIREIYEEKGDLISRFNSFGFSDSFEELYRYFQKKVGVEFDTLSGISTLRVKAYDAEDAKNINIHLLSAAELFINQLNERARGDSIKFALNSVETAEKKLKDTANDLSKFRIDNGVFDIEKQSEIHLSLISKLQDETISLQTQLAQIRSISPENPQIPTLESRIKSLNIEANKQAQKILGGADSSMAKKAISYQSLLLENKIAETQLTAAIASLERSKQEADKVQLYLEVIRHPIAPDYAAEPKRIYSIFSTFIISLLIYGVFSLLFASVREHKN